MGVDYYSLLWLYHHNIHKLTERLFVGVGYCLCVCVISWQYRETCRATSGPVLARTGPDWTSPHESLVTVNTAHDMGCARSGSFARFCHWSSLPYVISTRT